jgi:hypothetical protein
VKKWLRKVMTALTAILGLLPLPTFYLFVHDIGARWCLVPSPPRHT